MKTWKKIEETKKWAEEVMRAKEIAKQRNKSWKKQDRLAAIEF